MSLQKKAFRGVFWNSIQQFFTQGISFFVSIVLARLLAPEDFGLIAIISFFINFGNTLVESGLNQSLLRLQSPDDDDYSTIFFLNIIFSLIIFAIVFVSSNLIANFFNHAILSKLIKIYSFIFIVNAFSIVQNTKLIKTNNFKKQLIIAVPSILFGSLTSIIFAYKGYGVWSLVWGALVQSLISTMLLWKYGRWTPKFVYHKQKIFLHLNYGYKLTLSGVLETFFTSIYSLVIGKYFTPSQVGFYQRADSFKQLPVSNLIIIINKVTFPLLSEISENDERLINAYKSIIGLIMFIIFPVLFFMIILSEPLFRLLFTEKWLPAVPYFKILCINGIFYPINAYMLNILNIKGRTDVYLKIEILKKIILSIIILFTLKWGINGILFGSIFFSIISFFINSKFTFSYTNYSILEQIKDLLPTLFLTLIATSVVYLINRFLISSACSDITTIFFSSILGTLLYLTLSYTFKIKPLYYLINVFNLNKK
jgi:teichuronic acid exporter